jgi:preprotein translocase subunit SecE
MGLLSLFMPNVFFNFWYHAIEDLNIVLWGTPNEYKQTTVVVL